MPIHGLGQAEAFDMCPWLCGGPDYPSTPFAWPVFAIIDTLRVFITLGALAILALSFWAIRKAIIRGQRCRFLYTAGTAAIMIGTEIAHLGDWPHWRFLVSLVIVPIGLYGIHQHLFHERPARDAEPQGSAHP